MEELRDKVYTWALDLLKKGKELEGIFLLLATWNFAYFRYHMRTFPLEKFEKVLKECDFAYFNDKKFSNENLCDIKTKEKIKNIYSELSEIDGIKYVGASKVMHLKNPDFFMMWDSKIIKCYKAKTSPEGYYNFMAKMQEMYRKGRFKGLNKSVSIPKAIDEYSMVNCKD